MMHELKQKLHNLKKQLDQLVNQLDLPAKQRRKRELEVQTLSLNFWDNRAKAEKITQEIAVIENEQQEVEKIRQEIEDAFVMAELIQELEGRKQGEGDKKKDVGSRRQEAENLKFQINQIAKKIDRLGSTWRIRSFS